MNINNIAKALAKILISTNEYKLMNNRREALYADPKYGKDIKDYEDAQLKIINIDASPAKKEAMMKELKKRYQKLLSSREMREYLIAINEFQERTFRIFDELNREIGKIVNKY